MSAVAPQALREHGVPGRGGRIPQMMKDVRDRLREHYGRSYDEKIEPLRALMRPYRDQVVTLALQAALSAESAAGTGTAWPILAAAYDVAEEGQ